MAITRGVDSLRGMTTEQRITTLATLIAQGLYMGEKTLKQLAKRWGTDARPWTDYDDDDVDDDDGAPATTTSPSSLSLSR